MHLNLLITFKSSGIYNFKTLEYVNLKTSSRIYHNDSHTHFLEKTKILHKEQAFWYSSVDMKRYIPKLTIIIKLIFQQLLRFIVDTVPNSWPVIKKSFLMRIQNYPNKNKNWKLPIRPKIIFLWLKFKIIIRQIFRILETVKDSKI